MKLFRLLVLGSVASITATCARDGAQGHSGGGGLGGEGGLREGWGGDAAPPTSIGEGGTHPTDETKGSGHNSQRPDEGEVQSTGGSADNEATHTGGREAGSGGQTAAGGADLGGGGQVASGGANGSGGSDSSSGGSPGAGGSAAGGDGSIGSGGAHQDGRPGPCPIELTTSKPDLSTKQVPDPLPGIEAEQAFSFAEGPVWYEGALYFSYIVEVSGSALDGGHLLRYVPGGTITQVAADLGTNGLAVDSLGQLIAATHELQTIARVELGETTVEMSPLTSGYGGSSFNSPNDLVARSDGTVYFTDPNYQCGGCSSQPVQGTYRITPAGTVYLLDTVAQSRPNGIALSPDETILYVGGSELTAHAVQPDGSIGVGTRFGDVRDTDGLGVDCAGNVYVTLDGQNKIIVLDPSGTAIPGELTIPRPTNVAFGGADGRTMYVTSQQNNGALRAIAWDLPGYPY